MTEWDSQIFHARLRQKQLITYASKLGTELSNYLISPNGPAPKYLSIKQLFTTSNSPDEHELNLMFDINCFN